MTRFSLDFGQCAAQLLLRRGKKRAKAKNHWTSSLISKQGTMIKRLSVSSCLFYRDELLLIIIGYTQCLTKFFLQRIVKNILKRVKDVIVLRSVNSWSVNPNWDLNFRSMFIGYYCKIVAFSRKKFLITEIKATNS